MILIAPFKSISDKTEKLEPPPGRVITDTGTQYKAYTLEEYKTVAKIFIEYSSLFEVKKLEEQREKIQKEKEDLLERKIEIWRDESASQELRADTWMDLYDTQKEINTNLFEKQKKLNWVPWALVGVLGLTTGALGIVIGVSD